MNGLSEDQIMELLGKARGRNVYGPKLIEFMESDEAAINPKDTWPAEFANKSASALYQSFRQAAEKANVADQLQISQVGGQVFILHKEKVAVVLNSATTENTDSTEEN
jgi:hypothetical protein